jgi:DHA1 family bicyclomycin/chloramphenicol resistance-like MFS transporter
MPTLHPFAPGSRAYVLLLASLSGLIAFSVDICLPALPVLAEAFGASNQTAQLVLGLFLMGFAAGQFLWGPLADRFGRRSVALLGLGFYVGGAVLCAAAPSIEMLVAGRAVQGFGTAAGGVVGAAIVRDQFDRDQGARIMSQVMLAVGIAPLLAPTIGGIVLAVAHWRLIFVTLVVVGLVAGASVWLRLGESLRRPDPLALSPGRMAANLRRFFTTRSAIGNGLVRAFSFGAMYSYISGSPFVLIGGFGVPNWAYGFFFGSTAALMMVGSAINSRTVAQRGVAANRRLAMNICAVGGVFSLALALFRFEGVPGILATMAPIWLFMIAYGALAPTTMIASLEKLPDMAGAAGALMGALQMLSATTMGWLVARHFDGSAVSMGAAIFVMTTLAFAVERLALDESRR